MFTNTEVETLLRDFLDDPSPGARWTTAIIDDVMTMVLDKLWSDILISVPDYTSQLDTLTSLTAPGTIDLRTTGDGGDLSQRFVAVRNIVRNTRTYGQINPKRVVLEDGAVVAADDYAWIRYGNTLHLFPYEETPEVEFRYSYRPAKYNSLGAGADVEFPEGHEMVYIMRGVAMLMLKGGVEDTSAFAIQAKILYDEMIQALMSESPGPTVMFTSDEPESWGGLR